jgi:predicted MFS family arabinose efflux permease
VSESTEQSLGPGTTWLMAISVGVIVANLYYAQPLLVYIGRSFGLSVTSIGAIAMLTMIGNVCGQLVFVPLGDSRERRSLIFGLVLAAAVSLAAMASARNVLWLSLSSMAIGATAATVHLVIPFAATLAPAEQRGHVVGKVFSGLLFGILLARTISGFVGERFGWRAVFWGAAVAMVALAALIRIGLPKSRPAVSLSWVELVRSMGGLIKQYPEFRESAAMGAAFFCVFNAFWTTLVFFLQTPPYHYGGTVAGLFGLLGAAGAAAAPLFGRTTDRKGPRFTLLLALLTNVVAFAVLGVAGKMMAGLVVGVVLMDLGVQAGHVSNQTRIYGLNPSARSRLHTVYMICWFIGGSLGSYFGAVSWKLAGWIGVCSFALLVLVSALLFFGRSRVFGGRAS